MRFFEVVLILVNFLSLVAGFRKQSKAVCLAAAGLNVLALVIHGIVDSFRYQMAFSYAFVVLFAVLAFVKTRDRFFDTRTPSILKGVALSLTAVFLLLTAFLAYALPVFTLPKPSGSYAVGVQHYHWVDEQRNDPFLDGSQQKRELMVKIYYPAESDASKPFLPYFSNSPKLLRLFTAFYNLPDFMFDHLLLVKTHAKTGLRLAEEEQSYPVVLFSHGAGTSIEVQTSQSEDLASHGYIVAAIDHTYVSAATAFPDRVVSAKEATTVFNTVEPAEVITEIMADDARFVIDQLSDLNTGRIPTMFAGRLNLEQLGIIGHSVGGAVAYNLALNDDRVKAAINLDGRVFVTPQEESPRMDHFLMLAGDINHLETLQNRESLLRRFEELPEEERQMMIMMYGSQQAYEAAYAKARQNVLGLTAVLEASGNLYSITGSDHMKFTDLGLFFGSQWLRNLINIRGEIAPARCLEITQAVTRTFFDQRLKGNAQASVEHLISEYPELKKADW